MLFAVCEIMRSQTAMSKSIQTKTITLALIIVMQKKPRAIEVHLRERNQNIFAK